MRELIRHILKENRVQQSLKQVIDNGNIFDAADLVGGIPTLKKIFKDDPEMSSLFEKLTGIITFYYPVIAYEDIEFPLNYEIIGRHSNVHKTNHWPIINVLYDENKLTSEENEDFKSMIKYLYDDAQHSPFKSKFENSRIFNANYFTVEEINGENIELIERGSFSLTEAEELHDKLYGESKSLNENDNRETDKNLKAINVLLSLVSWDGLCDIWVEYNPDDKEYEIRSKTVSLYDSVSSIVEIEKELNHLEDSIKSMGIKVYIFTPWYVENCEDEVKFMNESESEDKDYSPAGKEITPNHIVVHKSNPMFRDKIMENGLKVRAGECYKVYVGYGVKCKPAIFATNSTNKRAWFGSTYDDDIWFIDTTKIPDVKWFKDRHFESRSKHIVTFQDIPKEAITLKYEGTGSSEDILNSWPEDSPNRLQESIRRILREDSLKNDLNESKEKQVKYLNILKDLVEPFKDEDCVCSVKVWYNDEDDMYLIDVEVGTQEMKEKFFAEVGKTHYVKKLRLKIKETIKDYLPIDNFYVGTYATPKCGTKRWWDDSLNEDSNKEKSLIKLIKKDGLYDLIEMTGLDFNQVRSLIKQIDNPKEILKQYIREFVLEHDGMSNGDYGSLFALRLPLSNTKYVNDILVQDSNQIAVEIWGYEEDEYGHTEQTEQYLTSINNLTTEELLSIISWMMETIEGGYWD
jgi:hypothetical protein